MPELEPIGKVRTEPAAASETVVKAMRLIMAIELSPLSVLGAPSPPNEDIAMRTNEAGRA
jgi:hypothetical protein